MSESDKLSYSIAEAVKALGLPRSSIFDLIRRGELPSVKIGRRRILTAEALRDFLRRREAAGRAGRHGSAEAAAP